MGRHVTVTVGDRSTRIIAPTVDDAGELLTGRDLTAACIGKAVVKLWGPRAFWWADSGLGVHYGQVIKALRPTRGDGNPGNSAITNRVRADVE